MPRTRLIGWLAAALMAVSACAVTDVAPITVSPTTQSPGGTGTTDTTDGEAPTTGSTADTPGTTGATDTTGTTTPGEPLPPLQGLDLDVLVTGLSQPTVIASPPGDDRLFIGERIGVIRIYDPNEGLLDEPFLSIPDRVTSNGIEQGFLGLAFHPNYAENGRFFVYHTDRDAKRQLAEYGVLPDDPNRADLDSGIVLFDRAQPPESVDIRHYGGMLMFGPDGYLYVTLGDGAAAQTTGQDPNSYFASVLRIDVDSGDPFGIPTDNPFVDGGGDPAVWAYGLRNPWRMTIDPVDRLMYIADVGQAALEEVNVVSLEEGGYNFGWPVMEGTNCFIPPDCDPTGFVPPVHVYDHSMGCSITGGHVYRGSAIPELHGHYFFADWCKGWVHSFAYENGQAGEVVDWSEDLGDAGQVNAFGIDRDGELYLVNFAGMLAKIVPVR